MKSNSKVSITDSSLSISEKLIEPSTAMDKLRDLLLEIVLGIFYGGAMFVAGCLTGLMR